MAQCPGRLDWPRRGVYFFMESGEDRSDSGHGPRIVRVGTHALKAGSSTKIWTRLAQHRGRSSTGHGNHRTSIFRLIVGASLGAREQQSISTWGVGNSAPAEVVAQEVPREIEVSGIIGCMPFLWLAIDDEPGPESLRRYIERNAIGLLSNYGKQALDAPSSTWLGRSCDRERVRLSGLWNSNHFDEPHEPAFLDQLERLIAA